MFTRRNNPPYYRLRNTPRSKIQPSKIGDAIIDKVVPDHAEIKVGGPAPLPRAKVEWDREKKERISQLRQNRFLA
jgi:hypothetical protein